MAANPAAQLKGCIAKFEPAMASRIRACRTALRRRCPTANELVYDNDNFFVIGYCTSKRPSDCVVSLAAMRRAAAAASIRRASDPRA